MSPPPPRTDLEEMVVMTVTEAGIDVPSVIIVSASEVGSRSGGLLRALASGMVVRVDDLRLKRTVGWLSAEPPASVAGLAGLPAPGEAADRLPPDELPS
jgi:hypothetical protein